MSQKYQDEHFRFDISCESSRKIHSIEIVEKTGKTHIFSTICEVVTDFCPQLYHIDLSAKGEKLNFLQDFPLILKRPLQN